MASRLNARTAQFAYVESLALESTHRPDKLDRLRELRATIEGLRLERESQDPLLAWNIAGANTERD